ncbi:histidine phosphatase family protein [uncultured Psychrobacter sp.]|uniref:histidine phosphatase family protein n=1 Tax=uncultured Psychrobacter sp. TaxID=259303 RepID=UPI00345B0050
MELYIWRHPKPLAANGLCLGQTDMGVHPRKLKRLANQIERFVRLHKLPKVIWVSPLQRSLKVGELLAQRGFKCQVAPDLMELNFGTWDGRPWSDIPKQAIDEWCADFAQSAPYKGESVQELFTRVETQIGSWLKACSIENNDEPVLAVGHAGWINVAKMLAAGEGVPQVAADWPRPVGYRELSSLRF